MFLVNFPKNMAKKNFTLYRPQKLESVFIGQFKGQRFPGKG